MTHRSVTLTLTADLTEWQRRIALWFAIPPKMLRHRRPARISRMHAAYRARHR